MSKNGHEVTPKVVPGTSSIATGSPASELKAALMFAWMAISRDWQHNGHQPHFYR